MTTLYRGMDRATLDAAYNNSKAVPGAARILADFRARSADVYRDLPCRRGLAYGPSSRQCYDWFAAGSSGAPTYVFIHGGYWQACAREDFAFIVHGPLQRGFNVVLAEYTLAPQASMTQIVGEIGALLDHLQADRDELGIAGHRLCLSGHSAGGHLAAMHRSHPVVSHAMPISALVDLEPISLGELNDKLQLTAREVEVSSPLRHIAPGPPTTVVVGDAELPELVRHSREYAAQCQQRGEIARYVPVPGCNHFSVLEDLASPTGVQMTALTQAMLQQ
ncbi:MAG: alpha/beta hydrolase [Burkholderiales bacterium]|nr:alpha/beta hydrolase [Burkholderiales bacterium]